jgi:hypothetical protein
MSFCRFAWDGSEVYVFGSSSGIECCGCKLQQNFTAGTPEEMITHLALHRRAGHYVPLYAIERLWAEIPGATAPNQGQPNGMTIASLMMQVAMLNERIEELKKQT